MVRKLWWPVILDEIGFMITPIDDKGFLRFKQLVAGGDRLCLHNA